MTPPTPKPAAPTPDVDGGLVPMADWLKPLPIAQDDEDVQESIAQQILSKGSVDDVLSGLPPTVGLRDLLGDELVIHDVRLRVSDIEGSKGAYALIDCTKTGEDDHFIATCGGVNVLAQLVRLFQLDAFPVKCTAYETVSKSNPKNKPLWLRPVGTF